ncbi:hypothetical protein GCM10023314_11680 [Algibacter agarivorans]|uniref:Uncharacterized protein n=1 Tax=Algibacter agarivorans TaxID=1109741 RepID=A0ABP9GN65_9FLAO
MYSTGNLKYERAIYGRTSTNDAKTMSYYKKEISSKSNGFELCTDIVRIEKDNGFHDTSRFFENYLYFRNDTNWLRCSKTGLSFTQFSKVFEGNISQIVELNTKTAKGKDFETPQHWVIAQLLNDNKILVVDIFRDFYPVSKELQKAIIQEHKLYKK